MNSPFKYKYPRLWRYQQFQLGKIVMTWACVLQERTGRLVGLDTLMESYDLGSDR